MATELERALARRNAPALTDLGGGLLLASARAASEPALLRRHGVTHVLNVADDVPRVVGDDVQYCCLGMGDFGSDPRALPRVMGSALAFVQPALAATPKLEPRAPSDPARRLSKTSSTYSRATTTPAA